MLVEWARIAPGRIVVATHDRSWLHELDGFQTSDPFAQPMSGPGSEASTERLLDAAVSAAQSVALADGAKPRLTPIRYAWQLVGHYHTTRPTTPLMKEAAARFGACGRPELAAFARRIARQEDGHDRLALLDLEALGYDSTALVRALFPPTAAALVAYFTRCALGPDPVEAFGYIYAAERTSVAISKEYVERVEAMLPHRVRATRCLRVHSAAGAEVGHLRDAVRSISRWAGRDRGRIACAAYQTALIISAPPEGGTPTDPDLDERLSPFRSSS